MDVVLLRWPEESHRLETLRSTRVPRLLLVGPDEPPPHLPHTLEDWIRLPADDRDVRARVKALEDRSERSSAVPEIDDAGLLRFRGRWVALSPVEQALASDMVADYGQVVSREALAKAAWPEGIPTRNALDVHVLRLRRRIAPVGLEIRTVRARGYLLQETAEPVPAGNGS